MRQSLQRALREIVRFYEAGRLAEARRRCRALLKKHPQQPVLLQVAGTLAREAGDHQEATGLLERALEVDPDFLEARLELGRSLFHLGRYAESEACFRAWLAERPEKASDWKDLGAACFAQRRLAEAEEALQRAVKLDPRFAQAWADLGSVQAARGQLEGPLRSTLQATRLDPEDLQYRCALGMMLLDQGHLEQAERCYRLVLRLEPQREEALAGLATVLERKGQLEEVFELLTPLVEAGSRQPSVGATYAAACRRLGRPELAVPVLRQMLAHGQNPVASTLLAHNLGALLEAQGDYDASFDAYKQANEALPARFDPPAHRASVDATMARFDAESFERLAQASHPSQVPLLIVGMPRSGTSLVEQILSGHPDVQAAGELEELRVVSLLTEQLTGGSYPDCLDQLTEEMAGRLQDWYLERLERRVGEAQRVTDKMPNNVHFLGLAALALPGARVIRCARDPLDTCLSCYFQNFKDAFAWSTRLEWLGAYHQEHLRLVEHWKRVLPLPFFELRYEQLVAEPEDVARELLRFCGLDWHPDCLSFHERKEYVRTASYEQVRRPIYRSSAGRAQRYSAHLGPLREALGMPAS